MRGEDEGRATSGTYGQADEGRWGEVGVRKKPSAFVINKDARWYCVLWLLLLVCLFICLFLLLILLLFSH